MSSSSSLFALVVSRQPVTLRSQKQQQHHHRVVHQLYASLSPACFRVKRVMHSFDVLIFALILDANNNNSSPWTRSNEKNRKIHQTHVNICQNFFVCCVLLCFASPFSARLLNTAPVMLLSHSCAITTIPFPFASADVPSANVTPPPSPYHK